MSATLLSSESAFVPEGPAGGSPVRRVFGEKPFRADAEVLALAFGPTGLWSLEEGGCLRQWDPETGRLVAWHVLDDAATVWAFRPDGQVLAGAATDLVLWDVATGKRRAVLPQEAWVTAVAFASDSDIVATGHDEGLICLWDTADGHLIRRLKGHQHPISALAFSGDGKRLASAAENRIILAWDVAEADVLGIFTGHTDRIPALAWHPDGNRLYSAGWDTTARVWDVETCEPIILLNSHAGQVTAMAMSSDGGLLACADSANAVHLWDVASNRTVQVFEEAAAEVRCLAFNRDGSRLAAGGADEFLHLWDPQHGRPCGGRAEPPSDGTRVALSPSGDRLASIHGKTLRLWDVAAGGIVMEQTESALLHGVAYSGDGQLVAAAGENVVVWGAVTGHPRWRLDGPKSPPAALAFSPNSSLLAAAGRESADVWLWDMHSGEPVLLMPDAVPGCVVQALAFHPREPLLAVGGSDWFEMTGSDGVVNLWDVQARRRVAMLGGGAMSLAFHPSGRRLAVASLDRTIRLWDLPGRRLLGEWSGHAATVRSVVFSPDGRWLASAGDDRTVRLWDVESGEVLGVADMPTRIQSLAFTPDGGSLFTGNGNDSCSQLAIRDLLKRA
jgi:WD40 repeat protein